MKTAVLAKRTGVHANTIRRLVGARLIDFKEVGGSHGYEFPEEAVEQVHAALAERSKRARASMRKKIADGRAQKRKGALA